MIDRHHGAVYRHALWLSGDPDTAADLTQDTYYEAWKSLCRQRGPRNELGWLLVILRRQAAKTYEARNRPPAFCTADLIEALSVPEQDVDSMLDLAGALQTMPLAQRDLLLLYALHGLSYEEISAQLEIPLGTVMSRLARARQALQRCMSHGGAAKIVPMKPRVGGRQRA